MQKISIRVLIISSLFVVSPVVGSENASWGVWGTLKKLFCRSHNAYQVPSAQPDDQEYRCVVWQDCSMCLGALFKDKNISLLPCSHMYHQTCIANWTQGCPACRKSIEQRSIIVCTKVEDVVSGLQEKIFTTNSELARSTRRASDLETQLRNSKTRVQHLENQQKFILVAGIVSASFVVVGSLKLLCSTRRKR